MNLDVKDGPEIVLEHTNEFDISQTSISGGVV